jgi:hypothetical protein
MYALPARENRHQSFKRVGGQLGPVVATDERRCGRALGDEALQRGDGLVGVDAAVTLDRQRLAGEFVDDMQQLEDLPVGGLVKLEVQRPYLVWCLGAQPIGWNRRGPQPLALAASLRRPQALFAPQPLRALAIELKAWLEQQLVRAPIPPARPVARDLAQRGAKPGVVAGEQRRAALRQAVLAGVSARPPLRDAETMLQHADRLAPARRAHQFRLLISLSAATSST